MEGLKVVAFGPFDLSVAMGFDGVRTPEVCTRALDFVNVLDPTQHQTRSAACLLRACCPQLGARRVS